MKDAPIDPPPRPMRLEPLGLVDLIDLHGETINIAKYAQALACELARNPHVSFPKLHRADAEPPCVSMRFFTRWSGPHASAWRFCSLMRGAPPLRTDYSRRTLIGPHSTIDRSGVIRAGVQLPFLVSDRSDVSRIPGYRDGPARSGA